MVSYGTTGEIGSRWEEYVSTRVSYIPKEGNPSNFYLQMDPPPAGAHQEEGATCHDTSVVPNSNTGGIGRGGGGLCWHRGQLRPQSGETW